MSFTETQLPDFDEMNDLAESAARAKAKIEMLERVEERLSAEFMRQAMLNKEYWFTNKPPNSTVHLAKIVAKVGNTDEQRTQLENIGEEIAHATEEYVRAVEKLQTCRDKIAVFQTESANKRIATV